MNNSEILSKLKEIKPVLEKDYFITEIGVFGSYIRGEQTSESDVDILIDHERGLTFFKLIDLENFISETLNVKVDIAFKKHLKPRIGKKILSEVIYMYKRDYADFIQDIIDAINSINSFIENMTFEEFCGDDKTASAVTRKFEIIGEAANRVPKDIQDKYNDVPWSYMIGMRNKIIHDYDGVNLAIVWDTAKESLKELLNLLESKKDLF